MNVADRRRPQSARRRRSLGDQPARISRNLGSSRDWRAGGWAVFILQFLSPFRNPLDAHHKSKQHANETMKLRGTEMTDGDAMYCRGYQPQVDAAVIARAS